MLNVYKLLLSNFLTKTGNYSAEVIIFLLSLEITDENYSLVGLIYLFRFIPYLLFGPIGGWVSDNYNKKLLMCFIELIRATIVLNLFILCMTENLNIINFTIGLSLLTCSRCIFQPAYQASVPILCNKDNLIKINSRNQVAEELGSLIGPLLTATIISISSKNIVLLVDFSTYILSFMIMLLVRFPSEESSKNRKLEFFKPFIDIYEHCKHLNKSNIDLISVIIRSSICIFFTASLLRFILPAYILEVTNNEAFVSYSFSAMAFGTIFGGLIFERLNLNLNKRNVLLSWFIYGLLFCSITITRNVPFMFMFMMLMLLGFSGAFVDILLVSYIQSNSEENNLGKNFSLFSTLANTGEAASGILGGVLATFGLKISLIIMSLMISLTPLLKIKLNKNNPPKQKC